MKERRLFVGNLPNDVSENSIESLFHNYNVSKVEIKRKKVLDEESVFAFVNVSSENVDKCLNDFRNKKWENRYLKVELAKESFLDRLRKEHSEKNKKQNAPTFENRISSNAFQLRQNSNGLKNKKIVFDSDNEGEEYNSTNIVKHSTKDVPRKRNSPVFRDEVEEPKSTSDVQSSPVDVPKRRNLPMFRGTASVVTENSKSSNNYVKTNSYVQTNIDPRKSISEAYSAMRRFEEFSDTWKDEPVQISNKEYKKITFKSRANVNQEEENIDDDVKKYKSQLSFNNTTKINFKSKYNQNQNEERVDSDAVKNKSELDDDSAKKINFKSTSNSAVEKKKLLWKKSSTVDKSSENISSTDDNNEKPVSWKSVVPEDERFKLDEKFFDSDDVPLDKKHKQKSCQSLEDKLQKNNVAKSVLEHRQLVRYDPMRPEHKILEKKPSKNSASQPTTPKEKKKKLKKTSDKQNMETNEKQIPVKPEVSKEKHYSVADSLKNAFKNTENQGEFRLSALFDQQIKQENSSITKRNAESKPVPLSSTEETASHRSSDSEFEEEMDEEPAEILPTPASEKVLGRCGVWGETFFFKKNDSRLQEAFDFFKSEDKKNVTDFDKQRSKLRSIIRKKLQNSKKDNKMFKQKLGGKINKSKFKMRLKKARV